MNRFYLLKHDGTHGGHFSLRHQTGNIDIHFAFLTNCELEAAMEIAFALNKSHGYEVKAEDCLGN